MVLFEHTIQDGAIVIKESELETERDRLIKQMERAKAENNADQWTFLCGQVKTIVDILWYFRFPEGRDNTDAVEFGG